MKVVKVLRGASEIFLVGFEPTTYTIHGVRNAPVKNPSLRRILGTFAFVWTSKSVKATAIPLCTVLLRNPGFCLPQLKKNL